MLNAIVFNPVNRRKSKRAPIDMAIKGFHLRGFPQTNDTRAADPTFTFKVNNADRLLDLPLSPFVKPYYFDQPMRVERNSEMEFDFFDPNGVVAAGNEPQLVIEYEPLHQVKRSGRTMMRHFRVGPALTYQNFELYRKYHVRVLSSFIYEDNNAAQPIIAYPVMNSTNTFVLKYQITDQKDLRMVDEGQLEWWRWGHFQRFVNSTAVGSVFSALPEVMRRRYWPGILIRPDFLFFMDRALPAAGLTQGTNFMFEYEYLLPDEFARLVQKPLTAPRS
jgi:hypothetical protein